MSEPAYPSLPAASRRTRLGLLTAIGLAASGSIGAARAEPPIQNQRDAGCREVARSRVFQTPDPQGLGPYELGRQIYQRCMSQGAAKGTPRGAARGAAKADRRARARR